MRHLELVEQAHHHAGRTRRIGDQEHGAAAGAEPGERVAGMREGAHAVVHDAPHVGQHDVVVARERSEILDEGRQGWHGGQRARRRCVRPECRDRAASPRPAAPDTRSPARFQASAASIADRRAARTAREPRRRGRANRRDRPASRRSARPPCRTAPRRIHQTRKNQTPTRKKNGNHEIRSDTSHCMPSCGAGCAAGRDPGSWNSVKIASSSKTTNTQMTKLSSCASSHVPRRRDASLQRARAALPNVSCAPPRRARAGRATTCGG